MKLSFFDSYHIRARICPAIILMAPIAITLFCCFGKAFSIVSSTVLLCALLSMANILPVWQRKWQKKLPFVNYAAEALMPDNPLLDAVTKKRYYRKLQTIQPEFACFESPDSSAQFKSACESAVSYLRNRSRENRLVQEENINFGFYRNLLLSKGAGTVLSLIGCGVSGVLLWLCLHSASALSDEISSLHCGISFVLNLMIFLFWLFVKKGRLQEIGQYYAKTLLRTIEMM